MKQDMKRRKINLDLKKQFLEKHETAVGPLKNRERIRCCSSESKQRSPPSLHLQAVSCDQMGPVVI